MIRLPRPLARAWKRLSTGPFSTKIVVILSSSMSAPLLCSAFAIANAEHNNGADIDELKITTIFVEKGPVLKRFHARAKGRGNRIIKPTCHVFLTVGDGKKD